MRDTTEELFAAALALPSNERHSYLTRACGTDHAQLERIRSLLADASRSAAFTNETDATIRLSDGSDHIDNYRLMQELGEGGCGTVYLAEQTAPIRRDVAIKIIKLGMDTKAVVARFEAERQALALMDHPNIARVFDAGATQAGRPYFVMEAVRGIKITEYCDQCRLTIQERLDLFMQVCSAIQHAHSRGVIHRDIKPSNVLVALNEGVATIKVIDFGIAKAMQGRLAHESVHTLVDQFMGTPAYVSPEQTQPAEGAIDERSDVYSLGSLLYELLVAQTPIDASSLYGSSLADVRARINNETPAKPSKRIVLFSEEERAGIARHRQTTQIEKTLRGDLDSIVMKCLAKSKAHRYQSASDLGCDIRRFLCNEPIEARPPSAFYSAKMFARRHRGAFAAVLTFSLVLVVGVSISTWQAIRALRAERLSQHAITSLIEVFELADPYREKGEELNAQAMLALAHIAARERLDIYPEAQARLLHAVGRIADRRGDFNQSVRSLEDAVSIYRQQRGDDANGFALCSALVDLTTTLRRHGDLTKAELALKEAEIVIQRANPVCAALDYRVFIEKGHMARELGAISESHNYMETSVELARQLAGPQSLEMANALDALSMNHAWMDRSSEAEDAARKALAIRSTRLAPLNASRVSSEQRLAEILLDQGRFNEAVPILLGVAQKMRSLFGANSLEAAQIHEILARATKGQRDLRAAREHSREAIRIFSVVKAPDSSHVGHYRTTLGYTLFELSEYSEAEIELREAQRTFSTSLPPDHPYVASVEYGLAEVLLRTDRLRDAEQLLRACRDRTSKSFSTPWRIARAESALGEALYRQGHKAEGERYILESYPKLANAPGVDTFARDRARKRVINLYKEQGRRAELAEFLAKYPDPQAPNAQQLVTDREQKAVTTSWPASRERPIPRLLLQSEPNSFSGR